jgi:signal transduction histidine kinase
LHPLGFFPLVDCFRKFFEKSMLALRVNTSDAGELRLPLCDSTAMALAAAVVEQDANQREAMLADALRIDPALAIWAVFGWTRGSAERESADASLTISTIGRWLAPRLIDMLSECVVKAFDLSKDDRGKFSSIVAESVRAANEVTRGMSVRDLVDEPRYLSGLLSQLSQWLAVTNGSPQSFQQSRWPIAQVDIPSDFIVESRAAGDAAWRRWLCDVPEVDLLLPAVVSQSQQLAKLNAEYDQQLQTEKLESLKEFAYGAGHELNNPLANIASRAQTLLKEEQHPERRRRLAAINTQAFRAHEMLADMMLFARPPQLRLESVDLVQLADGLVAELADEADEQQTQMVRRSEANSVRVDSDPVQIRVAIRALCINALQAIAAGGTIIIDLRERAAPEGTPPEPHVEIAVIDDGPGIPTEILKKIFDPFFSGREAGRGLGFGLSKCWRIVQLHGGQLIVDNQPGRGASFTISLPLRSAIIPRDAAARAAKS